MDYVERTISHIALNTVKEDFLFKKQLDLISVIVPEEDEKNLPMEEEI